VLPGLPPERAAELAKAAFTVQDLPAGLSLDDAQRRLAAAGQEGTAFLLAGGPGFRLLSHPDPVQVAASMPAGVSGSWRSLDASVLQQLLIGRLWGITDSERNVLIDHDAADAVRAVSCGPRSHRPRGYRGDLESRSLSKTSSRSRRWASGCRVNPRRSALSRAPAWSCARSARATAEVAVHDDPRRSGMMGSGRRDRG
jgi:hypothetical protein